MTGRYLVLEGGDASGKSWQADALVAWLKAQGVAVCHVREPGSTPTGEALRRLLLDPATGSLAPLTEALLFSAARAELLRAHVIPACATGTVVVAERCYLSTFVYQGTVHHEPGSAGDAAAGAVPLALLRAVTDAVHGTCWPDRIFLLDVDAGTRRQRADEAGKADRFEARDEAFHRAVRQAYLDLGAADPRVAVIDARPAAAVVQSELRRRVTALLEGTP